MLNLVTNYGAVPGTDCTAALQRAVDDVRTRGVPDTIYIPSAYQPYYTTAPILCDVDNLTICGDGPNQSVLKAGVPYRGSFLPAEHGIFQFGIDRAPGGTPIPPQCWQAAAGILDGTQGISGPVYGLRTLGTYWLSFNASPFSLGSYGLQSGMGQLWSGTPALTFDFCFRCNDAGGWQAATYPFFGMVETTVPRPFYCYYDGTAGLIRFFFLTSDGVIREARLPFPANSNPLLRCTIQLDLTNGVVGGWINRSQVVVDLTNIGTGWKSGLSLGGNRNSPFMVGGIGQKATGPSEIVNNAGRDLTLFGMKLSASVVYKIASTGSAQTRINPNVPINDAYQYLVKVGTDDEVGGLPLIDAGNIYKRVPYWGGWYAGCGLWMSPNDLSTAYHSNIVVRDLGFVSSSGGNYGHGQLISYGRVVDLTVRDCLLVGGAHGIGSQNFDVSYPLNYSQLRLESQTDAAIYSSLDIAYADRLFIFGCTGNAIRQWCGTGEWKNVLVQPSADGTCAFYGQGGGADMMSVLENWIIDQENSSTYPTLANVYMESCINTLLTVKRFATSSNPAANDIIRLVKGYFSSSLPVRADLEHVIFDGPMGHSVVSVDGPTWKGTLKGLYPSKFPAVFNSGTGTAGIIVG